MEVLRWDAEAAVEAVATKTKKKRNKQEVILFSSANLIKIIFYFLTK